MAEQPAERGWLVLTVEAPSDEHAAALAEGLLALGGTAVQEAAGRLLTYVRAPADVESFVAGARETLRSCVPDGDVELAWRRQAAEDWSQLWKRGLQPRRVGRRLVVAPSWSGYGGRAGEIVLTVDPEMAFGTGEHATTRGALRFLEMVITPGARVLDIGTGSAILAIAAARLGAAEVAAVENDADALINARDNVARNGVADRVGLLEQTVDEGWLAASVPPPFDVIVANVLSSVLVPLLPALHAAVRTGGHVILGGILEEEADAVLDAAAGAGLQLVAEDLEEEWWGVLLRRP